MFHNEGDFEGGKFTTPEALHAGRDASTPSWRHETSKVHIFERGDAIFFVSHKRHAVRDPLTFRGTLNDLPTPFVCANANMLGVMIVHTQVSPVSKGCRRVLVGRRKAFLYPIQQACDLNSTWSEILPWWHGGAAGGGTVAWTRAPLCAPL